MVDDDVVEIWTDGASKGNPGPGGWGAFLTYKGKTKEMCGGEVSTTNNRMELQGPIHALNALKRSCKVIIHTDSKYVQQGITEWIWGWKKKNWKTKGGTPVKNVELWKALDEAVSKHDVEWRWVKGHAGIENNEKADELANKGVEKALAEAKHR